MKNCTQTDSFSRRALKLATSRNDINKEQKDYSAVCGNEDQ